MIVLIDGPPGTNKTRIAEILGELGGLYYVTLIPHDLEERAASERKKDLARRYEFYLEVVRTASNKLEQLSRLRNAHVIIDEYWPGAIAVHRWLGIQSHLSDFGPIVREDVLVHLNASYSTSTARLRHRASDSGTGNKASGRLIEDPKRYAALQKAYDQVIEEYAIGETLKVNTGLHKTPEEICTKLLEAVIAR